MDDSQVESAATLREPALAPAPKPEWVAQVVSDILQGMALVARVETKDASDGGIAVALHFSESVPGIQAGRRSSLIDSLQFVANKLVNRPGVSRRWISIGVGGFPEPRAPRAERPARTSSPSAIPPPASQTSAPGPHIQPKRPPAPAPMDESALTVAEDAELLAAARGLAESSARRGRYYGIVTMKLEDRARVLRATAMVSGARVTLEGEGRQRRVVFTPEKPLPMPKQRVPGVVEEEEM